MAIVTSPVGRRPSARGSHLNTEPTRNGASFARASSAPPRPPARSGSDSPRRSGARRLCADVERDVVVRLREAGGREQADEILAARAFGALLDRARDAVASLTRAVEPGRGGVKLATLTNDSALARTIKDLRAAAKNYLEKANTAKVNEATSRAFAHTVVAVDDAEAIRAAGSTLW